MQKLLLALGIFSITSLSAEPAALAVQETCPVSVPECTPQPSICPECYVPSYYDLQCASGLYLYGDFFYWYANEDNLSPCMTVRGVADVAPGSGIAQTVLAAVEVNHLNTKWKPGFRVGLGYNTLHDGWDVETNYTWYQNKKHRSFSVPAFGSTLYPNNPAAGQLGFIDPWINPDLIASIVPFTYPEFDTVKSLWTLKLNQIDLDLGRKFLLSKSMAMRIYAGARGIWFTTRFNNIASSIAVFSSNFTNNIFSDKFKTRAWGVGLLGGFEPEWHFCRNFILFTNLDAALLWGKYRANKKEDYTSLNPTGVQTINYHNSFTNRFFKMQAILDLSIGLRWEETWRERVRTYLDFGWEHHIWFDDNHRIKLNPFFAYATVESTTVSGFQGYNELQGNLMMGGAVIRFRVDF